MGIGTRRALGGVLLLGACGPEIYTVLAPPQIPERPAPISLHDGWDDPPGTGVALIFNQIALASEGRGFDVDGRCDAAGCIDNFLWRLGELGNDQVRQGLLGGESLLLLEIAGLDQPYRGDDPEVTVKIHGARDADDPFFPANNFKVPPGHTTCCEFRINPQSIDPNTGQARARLRAKIEGGRLTTLEPGSIAYVLTVGVPPHPELRWERVQMSGLLPTSLDEFNEGLMGGVVPASVLDDTENPYCKTVSPRCPVSFTHSSLLDLVVSMIGPTPDIDLDGDGAECIFDSDGDGAFDRCCDRETGGCGERLCRGSVIAPIDPARPGSCVRATDMADGYSVGVTFTAVRATILGVGR